MPVHTAPIAALLGVLLHLLVLTLLSLRRSQLSEKSPPSTWVPLISTSTIRCAGVLSAFLTAALPFTLPDNAILQTSLRCVCFFYACKILDLALARADQPPTLLTTDSGKSEKPSAIPSRSGLDQLRYIWLLATEMRYPSFDTAAKQKGRPPTTPDPSSQAWPWLPLVVIPTLVFLYPAVEMKCLLILLLIQLGLDGLHAIFHVKRRSCTQPQFYKPFAANSFSSFWATHWHAGAAPFLQTLAYQPGKRYVGRWFGVLATFNLTGIWHAWAATPLIEPEYAFQLGFKVWAFFMVMGVGILAERVIWGDRQGGLVQRVVVWSIAISTAGWAFRPLECHARIGALRSGRCKT